MTINDVQQSELVIQLGHEPNRIDRLTSVTGLAFAPGHIRSIRAGRKGLLVMFIHLDEPKRNEKATG